MKRSDSYVNLSWEKYCAYPQTMDLGNVVELLVDGAQTYPAMLREINRAKKTILMDSYIFNADAAGKLFSLALCDAAERGCPCLSYSGRDRHPHDAGLPNFGMPAENVLDLAGIDVVTARLRFSIGIGADFELHARIEKILYGLVLVLFGSAGTIVFLGTIQTGLLLPGFVVKSRKSAFYSSPISSKNPLSL